MNKKTISALILIVGVVIVASTIFIKSNNKLPEDFVQVKRDIERGITYDLCTIGSEYWLQPEFYPNYQKFLDKEHDYSRWGVHGFGAYPGGVGYTVRNMKEGQTATVCTFIHSSFEIETFQGMKLTTVSSSPDLFYVDIEPDTFLLYPPFPDVTKNNKWATKVKIIVTAKRDIPDGSYDFELKTTSPDNEQSVKFMEEMKKYTMDTYKCPWFGACDEKIVELRKRVYVNAGQFTASEFFKFNIKNT